jgi:hypothetical protein
MEYKEELKGQVKVLRKIYNDIQYDPIHAEYADILSEEKEQLIVEYLLENAQYTVPLDIKSIKNALELKYDIFLDERDVAKTIDLVEYLVGSVGEAKNIAPKNFEEVRSAYDKMNIEGYKQTRESVDFRVKRNEDTTLVITKTKLSEFSSEDADIIDRLYSENNARFTSPNTFVLNKNANTIDIATILIEVDKELPYELTQEVNKIKTDNPLIKKFNDSVFKQNIQRVFGIDIEDQDFPVDISFEINGKQLRVPFLESYEDVSKYITKTDKLFVSLGLLAKHGIDYNLEKSIESDEDYENTVNFLMDNYELFIDDEGSNNAYEEICEILNIDAVDINRIKQKAENRIRQQSNQEMSVEEKLENKLPLINEEGKIDVDALWSASAHYIPPQRAKGKFVHQGKRIEEIPSDNGEKITNPAIDVVKLDHKRLHNKLIHSKDNRGDIYECIVDTIKNPLFVVEGEHNGVRRYQYISSFRNKDKSKHPVPMIVGVEQDEKSKEWIVKTAYKSTKAEYGKLASIVKYERDNLIYVDTDKIEGVEANASKYENIQENAQEIEQEASKSNSLSMEN